MCVRLFVRVNEHVPVGFRWCVCVDVLLCVFVGVSLSIFLGFFGW